MHILNIMLGKGHGGLEQVAIDYHLAFESRGHKVTTVVPPNSWAKTILLSFTSNIIDFKNAGEWDPIAAYKLSKIIKREKPDAIICHGNRAIRICLKGSNGSAPIIAVAHNYKNKKFDKCDAIFCITKQLVERMHSFGIPEEKIFHIPNMVAFAEAPNRPTLRTPPVIGAFGRFVDKKGFGVYIRALAILKNEGIKCNAILGGDGPNKEKLRSEIKQANLTNDITMIGWITDKDAFFKSIDVFVLPSKHEAFGIVLIEAMNEEVPCISTRSEGPIEILTDKMDGLLTPIDDAEALANAIKLLLSDYSLCTQFGEAGRETVRTKFTMSVVSKLLESSTTKLLPQFYNAN
ncbi:MAG TPA: glycosyltransferase [Phycisphaerales bacterium]|nr:glycosyltransferase [Phycisphaerales bacterium]HIO53268.1 glycosyltransferase [Phycisphaerales bacterium]